MSPQTLILWDVDRTLLYVGEMDRAVYRAAFLDVVGRLPTRLPERGTGRTMPLAVRELLAANDVPAQDVDEAAESIVRLLPPLLLAQKPALRSDGQLMPGAQDALEAVQAHPELVPTVVTGNLQESAAIKLAAFDLDGLVDLSVGGYASDDPHRRLLSRSLSDGPAPSTTPVSAGPTQ